jgi:methyl-accepting chemotaxis protein
MAKHERRTRILVNKPLQARVVLSLSWPALTCMLVTCLTLTSFCVKLGYEASTLDVELPSVVPVCLSAIAFMLVACVFFTYYAVKFSHRIAGPMVRIQRTIDAVKTGDLTARAHLRRTDHLGDLAGTLNEFLAWLEQHPPAGVPRAADGSAAGAASPAGAVAATGPAGEASR